MLLKCIFKNKCFSMYCYYFHYHLSKWFVDVSQYTTTMNVIAVPRLRVSVPAARKTLVLQNEGECRTISGSLKVNAELPAWVPIHYVHTILKCFAGNLPLFIAVAGFGLPARDAL